MDHIILRHEWGNVVKPFVVIGLILFIWLIAWMARYWAKNRD
jgi:hypothetical protein